MNLLLLIPAWGYQWIGGFALVEGLSPEIAILVVLPELVRVFRTHYEEGPKTLGRPA